VKFKLDENLSPTLAAAFLAAGHEAHSVLEQAHGAVVAFMNDAIRLLEREVLSGRLWVVESGRIRMLWNGDDGLFGPVPSADTVIKAL